MSLYLVLFFIHSQTPSYTAPVNPRSPAAALLWHFCVAPPCGLPAAALGDSRTRVWLIQTNHQTILPIDFNLTRLSHLFPGHHMSRTLHTPHPHANKPIYHVCVMGLSFFTVFSALIWFVDQVWFGLKLILAYLKAEQLIILTKMWQKEMVFHTKKGCNVYERSIWLLNICFCFVLFLWMPKEQS